MGGGYWGGVFLPKVRPTPRLFAIPIGAFFWTPAGG